MDIIEKNRIRFRKSFNSLFRGIQQVYFRKSFFRDEILEIYGNHFYEHIEFIFEKLRDRLEQRIRDFSMNIMYNNILNVIVLFFILDYQKIYRNEKGIDAFIDKIFDIGFSFEEGKGYFHLDLKYVIETIGFHYEQFENIKKLEIPILSILFSKNYSFQYRELNIDSSMNEPSSPTDNHKTQPVQMEMSVEKQVIMPNTMHDTMVISLLNIVQQYTVKNDEMEKMILQMKSRIETLETMNQSVVLMNTQLQNVNTHLQNTNVILQKDKEVLQNVVAEKNLEIDSLQPSFSPLLFQDLSPRSITNTGYQSPILDAILGKPFTF
jgi:hypothetical protein